MITKEENLQFDKTFDFSETEKKIEDYSEDKLFKKFDKLSKILKKSGAKILYPAILLYLVLMESKTPLQVKVMIMGSLGYLISPIDCIPDVIVGLGLTDDFSALYMALSNVKVYITESIKNDAKKIITKWIPEITIEEFDNMDRLLRL